jgi:pre-mRNA-splicing factor ATP-dependent RNA helicase DHX15/PRP43
MSGIKENPYLAHLPPSERGVSVSKAGTSNSDPSSKEPLYGFMPRKVKGVQVRKALVRATVYYLQRCSSLIFVHQEHDLNPFTKQPHSAQYMKILAARRKLPVFAQLDEFMEMVSS